MPDLEGMFDGLFIVEAVNSVALSHEDGCDCLACRAAGGDRGALAEVMVAVREDRERREAKP